ncbi:MAG TPA: GNAT family N-acetyltransferase [Fimbriimonadaceae bacterium]|nr:GNAT family N-acetyltransferase [Fimbriimonadaceae bacterium]
MVRAPLQEDDNAIGRLISMVMIAPYDAEMIRDRRERYRHKQRYERVAALGTAVVGIAEITESGAPTCAMARIVIEPEYRNQGIGRRLLQELESSPVFQSSKVFAQVADNDERSLAFAKRQGFEVKAHVFESEIDPQEFDLSVFSNAIENLKSNGIRFTTLAELGDNEENRYRLWHLEYITDLDIPSLDPDHLQGWEDAKDSVFTAKWFNPEGEFVALAGDEWAGISGVGEVSPGSWSVLHTCTAKEFRGMGLATALKALSTEFIRKSGGHQLKTNNHSENHTMLSINRRFGFQPLPGWYDLTKTNP